MVSKVAGKTNVKIGDKVNNSKDKLTSNTSFINNMKLDVTNKGTCAKNKSKKILNPYKQIPKRNDKLTEQIRAIMGKDVRRSIDSQSKESIPNSVESSCEDPPSVHSHDSDFSGDEGSLGSTLGRRRTNRKKPPVSSLGSPVATSGSNQEEISIKTVQDSQEDLFKKVRELKEELSVVNDMPAESRKSLQDDLGKVLAGLSVSQESIRDLCNTQRQIDSCISSMSATQMMIEDTIRPNRSFQVTSRDAWKMDSEESSGRSELEPSQDVQNKRAMRLDLINPYAQKDDETFLSKSSTASWSESSSENREFQVFDEEEGRSLDSLILPMGQSLEESTVIGEEEGTTMTHGGASVKEGHVDSILEFPIFTGRRMSSNYMIEEASRDEDSQSTSNEGGENKDNDGSAEGSGQAGKYDSVREKQDESFRLVGQNCNGVFPKYASLDEHYCPSMESFQNIWSDVILISETNVAWKKEDKCYEAEILNKKIFTGAIKTVVASTPYEGPLQGTYQSGGVLSVTTARVTSRICRNTSDHAGRWTKQTFQAKEGKIAIYNVYRPNPATKKNCRTFFSVDVSVEVVEAKSRG